MTKYLLSLALFLMAFAAQAQQEAKPEMADGLRADGKIWVVVAVIVLILAGFIAYLVTLDMKVKKLEGLLPEKDAQTK